MNKIALHLLIFLLAACASRQAPGETAPAGPGGGRTYTPLVETLARTDGSPASLPPGLNRVLRGRLILILYGQKGNRLVEIQLESGQIRTLFQAPGYSWLGSAQASPDGQQLLLTYASPPPQGEPQLGYTGLYLLPSNGSGQPEPFLIAEASGESFFYPTWAPDGSTIYYTHVYPLNPEGQTPAFQNDIEQATLDGETNTVLTHALWPAISPDGSRISYLSVDPVTLGNDLYTADPDGSSPAPVLAPGANPPVDAHLFTQDGRQLIFSMVNEQPAPARSWLEKLFSVEVVTAHSVPSDWYRVPVQGGALQRLTNLNDVGLAGDISPDGNYIAFISATGLYIIALDGSDLFQVSRDVLVGTVDWVPDSR